MSKLEKTINNNKYVCLDKKYFCENDCQKKCKS